MLLPLWLTVIILGIVEGLTEFIPVSSTGHLILVDAFLNFKTVLGDDNKAKLFDVFIQSGAIMAIGLIYRDKLSGMVVRSIVPGSPERRLLLAIIIGFVPAALIGFLGHHYIEEHLFSPVNVAWALIVGGVVIMIIERLPLRAVTASSEQITFSQALAVGLAQILSLVPGTSRSAATIMGGMCAGLDRRTATEFSFLLSFPVLIAASGLVLVRHADLLHGSMLTVLALGFFVAFVSAWFVVKWLIRYVQHHTFDLFAVYRIILGVGLLLIFWQKKSS